MSCPALTNKGGKLYISDQPVGCELTLSELAVLDYVFVPGVGSIGDTGIEQDVVRYPTTDAGLTAQGKGDAVARNWDIEVLDAPSQARDILDDASAIGNDDNYATRIEWPNGDVEFSIVQVASRTAVKGDASGVRVIRYTMVPSFVPIVTNSLPVASNVVVSGTYFAGYTLTATYDYYSPLGLPESGSVYQWYADGVAIPGADGLAYVIDEAYEGKMISFGVEPSDGLSFGQEARSAAGGPVLFAPEILFEGGLYGGGIWYAKRIINGTQVMYQDAAGTIPVTSDGDPVGLVIDRSLGYDRGVVNLLSYSEDFENSAWTKSRVSVSGNTVTDTESGNHTLTGPTFMEAGGAVMLAFFDMAPGTASWVQISSNASQGINKWINFNLATGEAGNMGAGILAYGSIPISGGFRVWAAWETVAALATATVIMTNNTNAATRALIYAATGQTISLFRAQLTRNAMEPEEYQPKTNTLAEGGNHRYQTEAGRRAIYHTDGTYEKITPDGIDDFYVTVGDVDMKGSTVSSLAMSASRGASAAEKTVMAMSSDVASNNGVSRAGFAVSGVPVYLHKGTAISTVTGSTALGPTAPVDIVARGDIPSDYAQMIEQGSGGTVSAQDQGTGAMGNYPVYSFSRGGVSNFFDGDWYGDMLISRFLTSEQMAQINTYLAGLHP